jgi:phosphatidylserine/phosphatidylglycerophosphate/cardiolipin synthase-like enzyme
MGKITAARAYANNEIALIAWDIDEMIDGCLGFDIVRIRTDGSEPPKGLPAWVPFKGQDNPDWKPQDTGVWPIQKLYWRDLTLRQHRDDLGRRPIGFEVKYSIRPVGDMKPGLEPVPVRQDQTYTGTPRKLGYLGAAQETNTVRVDTDCDGVRATFTNGILAAQWLRHAIEDQGKTFSTEEVAAAMADEKNPIRAYLAGDVLETVTLFLTDPKYKDGDLRLALYELKDDQLVDLLIKNKKRVEVILSNTSKESGGTKWDATNKDSRAKLHKSGVKVHDRMFNNDHIGHNKFAVWRNDGNASAVMTGSTNWTSTGLCGQSNNALIIESGPLAEAYDQYWERLLDDKFPAPRPLTKAGAAKQCQGAEIRDADKTPFEGSLRDGARLTAWYSPNTDATRKGKTAPPDLKMLFDLMSKAQDAIFFLAFLPSRDGADSIISAAIDTSSKKKDLIVAGALSDVTAMPGYVPANKKTGEAGVKPYTFDKGGLHIVRAAALQDDVGKFEKKELLKVGHAIVHDKIVVIDPLSPNCVVAAGSHNLGFKASYENDENLFIIQGNQPLARAYAVHVMDVYDHYRFRAWQAKEKEEGKPLFQGHINGDDKWLRNYTKPNRRDIATYFA